MGRSSGDKCDGLDGAFTLANLGDVTGKSGATLEADSVAAGVSGFQRPEDGSWDPINPHVFYFVTTAGFTNKSRLWRLTFDDPADPAAGGTIDEVLSGDEGHKMLDNMTVNRQGQVLIRRTSGTTRAWARSGSTTPPATR
jgi:hypothetical protein